MVARQSVPVVGAQGSPYLQKGHWQLFAGYRYQRSDRHFTGKHEDTGRLTEHSEVINTVNLLDIAATYAVDQRLNLSLSFPFLFANRSNPIREAGVVVDRYTTRTRNLGDMSFMARTWVLDPEVHKEQNLSLGIGVKFPTGDPAVQDLHRPTRTTTLIRAVDQSIQPGDGGWGAIVDVQAFKRIWKTTFSAAATYLINPRNTNGVLTGRSRPSEAVMSVPDQYLVRIGAAYPVLPKRGLALSLAGRWEGVPVTDWFGKSDGFRRPGYAVSIEPGLLLAWGDNTLTLNTPVALSRNRQRSVPDIRDGRAGDAAFADHFLLLGFVRRF